MDSNKRPENMERITSTALAEAFIEEQLKALREQIGDRKVLLALSGGVDSISSSSTPHQSSRKAASVRTRKSRTPQKRRARAGSAGVPR